MTDTTTPSYEDFWAQLDAAKPVADDIKSTNYNLVRRHAASLGLTPGEEYSTAWGPDALSSDWLEEKAKTLTEKINKDQSTEILRNGTKRANSSATNADADAAAAAIKNDGKDRSKWSVMTPRDGIDGVTPEAPNEANTPDPDSLAGMVAQAIQSVAANSTAGRAIAALGSLLGVNTTPLSVAEQFGLNQGNGPVGNGGPMGGGGYGISVGGDAIDTEGSGEAAATSNASALGIGPTGPNASAAAQANALADSGRASLAAQAEGAKADPHEGAPAAETGPNTDGMFGDGVSIGDGTSIGTGTGDNAGASDGSDGGYW